MDFIDQRSEHDVSHYLRLDPRRVSPGCVRKLDDEDRVRISMSCFSVLRLEFLPYVSSALDKDVEVEVKPNRHSPPQSSVINHSIRNGSRTLVFCMLKNCSSTGKTGPAANLSSGWDFTL